MEIGSLDLLVNTIYRITESFAMECSVMKKSMLILFQKKDIITVYAVPIDPIRASIKVNVSIMILLFTGVYHRFLRKRSFWINDL